MRRADRLFQLVNLLRKRRAVTAAELAQHLEVSLRTVYRDVQDLILSGVPIEGEAGVGYRLRPGFDLPPLMFTLEEVIALRVGARLVQTWADPDLAKAAASALARLEAVLPEPIRQQSSEPAIFAPGFVVSPEVRETLRRIRAAIQERLYLQLAYADAQGRATERRAQPLALFFWGATWTLGAWCERRQGFRSFRVDRMKSCLVLAERFETIPGRTLSDLIANFREDS
jgi:predicted DNA-binding transcriptional regulator YafY